MTSNDFIHPLSTIETIVVNEGEKQVMNSWAFASMIWSKVLAGNKNALGIANELFTDKSQIAVLLLASKNGNQKATLSAVNTLAFAIDEKLAEAFEPEN